MPLFFPGTPSQLFNSSGVSSALLALKNPSGLAVDTYGDVFVADTGNSKVVVDCLSTTTAAVSGTGSGGTTNSFCGNSTYLGNVVALGTSFTSPAGIALDGRGTISTSSTAAPTPSHCSAASPWRLPLLLHRPRPSAEPRSAVRRELLSTATPTSTLRTQATIAS